MHGADLSAAESDVIRRRANLQTRTAVIAVREATAHSRRANVERLKELQAFKRIVAPFDGIVTQRTAEIGSLITAGKESIYVIEDMSRVRVQMHVPQTYAAEIGPGVQADIHLPDSTVPAVRGTVTRISNSVDAASRTMLAEIELENGAHHLQPGSYAHVIMQMPSNIAGWTIPTNTLQMHVDGPHVAVVNGQGQIEINRVHLGRDLGTRIVVLEGIRGDERLVVNPGDELTVGQRVQVANAKSAEQVAKD